MEASDVTIQPRRAGKLCRLSLPGCQCLGKDAIWSMALQFQKFSVIRVASSSTFFCGISSHPQTLPKKGIKLVMLFQDPVSLATGDWTRVDS